MKLVITTPLYPPEPGGPATYAKILEDSFPKQGDVVTLVKFSAVRKYPKVFRHILYFFHVHAAIKDADVVLALDPVSVGFPTALAALLRGIPYVVKIVGDFAWEQGRQRFSIQESLDEFVKRERVPFAVACMRVVEKFVAKHAKKIIVPSNYLKSIITQWGIAPEKIDVVYNAVEIGAVTPAPYDGPRPLIVSVGRLVPWKGFDGLIDAVAQVREKFPDIQLHIIGDGPDREELEAYGKEKLKGAVSFVGAKSHTETLARMKAADVFVLNSSYEGLSHTLIEALLLNCTIVASDAGGNPELIRNGENGLLVPTGDTTALAAALSDAMAADVRERIVLGTKSSAELFAIERMITSTRRLLATTAGRD